MRGLTLDGSIGYTDPKYKTYLYLDPATDTVINVASEARMSQAAKFNAHVGAHVFGEATVRCRRWVCHQAATVADIVRNVDQFDCIEQGHCLLATAVKNEGEDRAAGGHLAHR